MAVGGVVLVGLFAVTAASGHEMSRSTLWTLLVLQALAAAAVAEGLTGHMNIQGELSKLTVKAGGSLAVAAAVLWAGMQFAEGPSKRAPATTSLPGSGSGGALAKADPAPGGPGGSGSINETSVKRFKGTLDVEHGPVETHGADHPEINKTNVSDSDASIKIVTKGVKTRSR
jgi:hypothetical protein